MAVDEAAGARAFEARPFPALTAAQRLHLDVHGFVVWSRATPSLSAQF
jgi:hypothetical protein